MLTKRLPRYSLRAPSNRFTSSAPIRRLTTTRSLRAEGHVDGHGVQYDPPSGWLWGIRPGEKYEKEGWEGIFFYGYMGSIAVAAIVYAFKPDTS